MARSAKKSGKRCTWSVASAKARLSEVLHRAEAEGPQRIARRGDVVAVVVSVREWEDKHQPPGSFLDFLMRSPLRGSGIEFDRQDEPPREVKF